MYAYLKGIIRDISEDNVVLDVHDIGYNVKISAGTAGRLPGSGEMVCLYTYTLVKEDTLALYGFLSRDELSLFRQLITVSGIGPKGGLALLSAMDADSLRFAILSEDVKAITRAPGIGKRTAERLILELKEKVSVEDTAAGKAVIAGNTAGSADSEQKREAIAALISLGYGQSEATHAVNTVENAEEMDAGAILKAALKRLI